MTFTKEQVDCIINEFGECWLNSDDNLVYLASIKEDPCDTKSEKYLIEKGVKEKGIFKTENILSISEIPQVCNLNKSQIKRLNFSVDAIRLINENSQLPVVEKTVASITPQSIKTLKIKPIVAGSALSANHAANKTGTIGAFLRINPYKDSNEVFLITNYHVLVNSKFIQDDLIFHPNNDNNDYSNYFGNLDFGQYYNSGNPDFTLDVAFVKINLSFLRNNPVFSNNCIFRQGFIDNLEVLKGTDTILKDIQKPKIGMKVKLHGIRTVMSGETIIRSINTMVKISNAYKDDKNSPFYKLGKTLIFKKQLLTNSISKFGDSGSLLINSNNKAVGLNHAGDNKNVSIFNNINHIFGRTYSTNEGDFKINFNKFLT